MLREYKQIQYIDEILLSQYLEKGAREMYRDENLISLNSTADYLILRDQGVLDRIGYFGLSLSISDLTFRLEESIVRILKAYSLWQDSSLIEGLVEPITLITKSNKADLVILPLISDDIITEYIQSGREDYQNFISEKFKIE